MNNRGSAGFAWMYGIVFLFGLGILYIIFNQIFMVHLIPTITDALTSQGNVDPTTVAEIEGNIDKYMAFFHILPFVLFGVTIIYMIFAAVRKERESEYL